MMAGNQPRVNTLTRVSNASLLNTPNFTILTSATARAGDILVLYDRASSNNGVAPSAVTPVGFTELITTSLNVAPGSLSLRSSLTFKVLTSSDLGTSKTGMNSIGSIASTNKVLLYVRPIYRTSSIQYIPTVTFNSGANNGTSVANQTLLANTIINNNMSLLLAQYASNLSGIGTATRTSTGPYTFTEQTATQLHFARWAFAPLGTALTTNTVIGLTTAPAGEVIILHSGILTIK